MASEPQAAVFAVQLYSTATHANYPNYPTVWATYTVDGSSNKVLGMSTVDANHHTLTHSTKGLVTNFGSREPPVAFVLPRVKVEFGEHWLPSIATDLLICPHLC